MRATLSLFGAQASFFLVLAASCCGIKAAVEQQPPLRITLHHHHKSHTVANRCHAVEDEDQDHYRQDHLSPSPSPLDRLASTSYLMRHPPVGGRGANQKRACHAGLHAGDYQPFMGTIEIGTPPKKFEVLFDTGSAVTWVVHDKCQDGDNLTWDSGLRAKYNHEQSASYRRELPERSRVKFGAGVELRGWWMNDTVRVGDALEASRSLVVRDQPLAMICQLHGPASAFDAESFTTALVGLSFPTSTSGNHSTLFESMLARELLQEPVFSFYTRHQETRAASERAQRQTGELILGQIDKSLYQGTIAWTNVTETPGWQIRVHSVRVLADGEPRSGRKSPSASACAHGCEAVVSTGTNMIAGPSEEVGPLNERLGFARNRHDPSIFTAAGPCEHHEPRNLSLVVQVEQSYLELTSERYMYNLELGRGRQLCVSALRSLAPSDTIEKWILGAPLVASYYTIFDYGALRVGFAQPTRPRTLRSS